MKTRSIQILFLLFLVLGTVYIAFAERNTPFQTNKGKIFGTFYTITYQSRNDLHKEILAELERVDQSLSMFNPESTISAVNKNMEAEVDELFAEVFRLAKQISDDTDGAFDITVAPLVNAWGFGFKNDTEPTPAAIDSILQTVGYKTVELTGRRIVKENPLTMLDCSAIAKGFGCDRVALLLQNRGVENFMVEIGGEVIVSGKNPKQEMWRVGIEKPHDDSNPSAHEIQEVKELTNRAMATSGNYRNFYYRDGQKFAHTIDPSTGRPVQHSVLSATVFAPSCAKADAYATAFMVMGLDRAKEVLARHREMSAYIIYADSTGENKIWEK